MRLDVVFRGAPRSELRTPPGCWNASGEKHLGETVVSAGREGPPCAGSRGSRAHVLMRCQERDGRPGHGCRERGRLIPSRSNRRAARCGRLPRDGSGAGLLLGFMRGSSSPLVRTIPSSIFSASVQPQGRRQAEMTDDAKTCRGTSGPSVSRGSGLTSTAPPRCHWFLGYLRQVRRRFGEVAHQGKALLIRITDLTQLEDLGEALPECEDGRRGRIGCGQDRRSQASFGFRRTCDR